ncbi:MAG: hypothetical protein C0423_01895 [Methylibium sp.]|nr:hypothetical protein [Methylibium sp.]
MTYRTDSRRYQPLDLVLAAGALDVTRQALHNARARWKRACARAAEEGREPPPNPWPIVHAPDGKGRGHQLVVDVVKGEPFMRHRRRRGVCAERMAMLQQRAQGIDEGDR